VPLPPLRGGARRVFNGATCTRDLTEADAPSIYAAVILTDARSSGWEGREPPRARRGAGPRRPAAAAPPVRPAFPPLPARARNS
jgi:hypothetical protein